MSLPPDTMLFADPLRDVWQAFCDPIHGVLACATLDDVDPVFQNLPEVANFMNVPPVGTLLQENDESSAIVKRTFTIRP